VDQHGSAAPWRPCTTDRRLLGEAALVEKDQDRSRLLGFFLTAGQVRVFQ
jgi:hypothetical protein